MRILGLKLSRYQQWWLVMQIEVFRSDCNILGKMRLLFQIAGQIRKMPPGWRQIRFRRLRRCYRCPVFDRQLRRCGPQGFAVGCRCWEPLATIFKQKGWLREVGQDDEAKICW